MAHFGWSYPAGCSGTPYDDDLVPEDCPQCGETNADDFDWLDAEHAPFCSAECFDAYNAEQAAAMLAEGAALAADFTDQHPAWWATLDQPC